MTEEKKTKLRMNLAAIQNVDPYAKEIIDSSSHVAYYKFIANEWEKSDIEGAFFIYSRIAEPFHSIFINNRLHTTSLIEPIDPHIQMQENSPFLLYRSQKNQIFGFWFYSPDDCIRIHNLLLNIVKRVKSTGKIEDVPRSEVKKGDDVDIFSMLSTAQKNFMTTASPQSQPAQTRPPPQQQQQPVFINAAQLAQQQQKQHHGQPAHMPHPINVPVPHDITVPTVANFFAAAQKPAPNNRQAPHNTPQQAQVVPKNACPTVDEIEKLHRQMSSTVSVSPKPSNATPQAPAVNSNQIKLQQQQPRPEPIVTNNNKPKGPTLVTPNMLLKSSNEVNNKQNHTQKQQPLDSQQLLQALKYLLENDAEFVRKIHETYVNNFQNNRH